jgi:RsiW-degrading membrane proteinase PrsW (M82 family)
VSATSFWLRAAGPIFGGAILWLQYFDLKDALRPEPRRMIVLGFLLGALAAPLALVAYRAVSWLGVAGIGGDAWHDTLYCLGVVGPIEEGAKFLVAWAVLFHTRFFDEPVDGLVYAAAVAIGFASVENATYATIVSWPVGLARAATSPLTHSVFSALWGFGAGKALLQTRSAWSKLCWLVLPLSAAALVHGLYDAAIVVLEAPWVSALLVLIVWMFVIGHARRVVKGRIPAS